MSRHRIARIALALGIVIVAAIATYSFRGVLLDRLRPGAGSSAGVALVGGPFTLIDQDGRSRSDAEFRGKLMLIYFGYTYCPDVCPATLAAMTDALDKLGPLAAKVQPIFITVDPGRDKPETLKRYIANFHPSFVALTGSPSEIATAARAYRVYFAKAEGSAADKDYLVDHSSFIYLMGPDGKYIALFPSQIGPDQLAERLRKFIPG